jgi:hypothetical protein
MMMTRCNEQKPVASVMIVYALHMVIDLRQFSARARVIKRNHVKETRDSRMNLQSPMCGDGSLKREGPVVC